MTRRQLLFGLAGVPLIAWAAGGQPQLSLQGTAAQAWPLFVSLLGEPGEEAPEVQWEARRFPMAWVGERWRTLVPIGIDTRGKQPLKVWRAGTLVAERSVPVQPRDYGTQYLSLPATTLASYDDPQNKADDQAILAAMKKFDPQPRWDGPFILPCEAPQSTGFGQRRLYNGWKKSWHKGLDLAGWEGQEVVAPANGKVIHRARGIVNGNTLVLSHGLGLFTVYFHLYGFSVENGEDVRQGQKIAAVGGTGGFAPHLHWEARVFGEPVHPRAFFHWPSGWV